MILEMSTLPIFVKYILTGLIGMVPIIELRGAIPVGVGVFHLNYIEAFICSFIGNIIPVYFIVKYIRPLFDFFGRWKPFKKIIDWASEKAHKHIAENNKLQTAVNFALFAFVAIPLPGTGGWTGALLASLLRMPIKKSAPAIGIGIILAAAIMSFITYGIPWIVSVF